MEEKALSRKENKEYISKGNLFLILNCILTSLILIFSSLYFNSIDSDIKDLKLMRGSNPPAITVGKSDKVDIITTSSKIFIQLEAKKLFPDDKEEKNIKSNKNKKGVE